LTNLKSEIEYGSGFDADAGGCRVEATSNISCETLAGSMKLPASFLSSTGFAGSLTVFVRLAPICCRAIRELCSDNV